MQILAPHKSTKMNIANGMQFVMDGNLSAIKAKTNTAIIKPMIEMITCNTKIPPKNKNMI